MKPRIPEYVRAAALRKNDAWSAHDAGEHRGAGAAFGKFDCPRCVPVILDYERALDKWGDDIDAALASMRY